MVGKEVEYAFAVYLKMPFWYSMALYVHEEPQSE
jgi:hypothetical protein